LIEHKLALPRQKFDLIFLSIRLIAGQKTVQETYFARQFVFESSVMDLPGYFGETASAPKPLPNPKMEKAAL
jgi:hypothetical protein